MDEPARQEDDTEDKAAKVAAVALVVGEILAGSDAVTVVAKSLVEAGPTLTSEQIVALVKRRAFLDGDLNDTWRAVFSRPTSAGTAGLLASLTLGELRPRIADPAELRRLGAFGPLLPALLEKHAKDAAAAYVSTGRLRELLAQMTHAAVRRTVLTRTWRDLVGSCLAGLDPGRWRHWIFVPPVAHADPRVSEFLEEGRLVITCELMAVSNLIDFRDQRLLDRLARRFAPRWETDETVVADVHGPARPDPGDPADERDDERVESDDSLDERDDERVESDDSLEARDDVRVEQVKPPREPTAEELARLQELLGRAGARLADAMVHARAILEAREREHQPGYATFLGHMATGTDDHLTPLQRTHAYNALARLIAPFGFACGEPLDKAPAKIGARHVLPPGLPFKTLREQASKRHYTLLERDNKRFSLKKIAAEDRLSWPQGSDADWGRLEGLIAELVGARLVAREALHGGGTRFIFEGGLVDMPPVPPHLRDTDDNDGDVPRVGSGRVIALPKRALLLEAKAHDPAFVQRIVPSLPAPLERTHKGNWFYFPGGGVDV